jgi:hypothetical protein
MENILVIYLHGIYKVPVLLQTFETNLHIIIC